MERRYFSDDSWSHFVSKLLALFSKKTHTHVKEEIVDFPTIPSKISELENDSGYTKVTVDAALSQTSVNPVQNKVLYEKFAEVIGTDQLATKAEVQEYLGI